MIKNLILLIFSAVTKTQPFSFVDIEELGKKKYDDIWFLSQSSKYRDILSSIAT